MEKIPALHQLHFNQTEREFLDHKFGTTERKSRIEKIKEFLLREESVTKLSLKEQKTQQEILNLKIKNQIALVRELKETPNDTANFIKNPESYQTPQLEEPKEKTGFDENGYCDVCKHKHALTEPRVCTDLSCNCGVTG